MQKLAATERKLRKLIKRDFQNMSHRKLEKLYLKYKNVSKVLPSESSAVTSNPKNTITPPVTHDTAVQIPPIVTPPPIQQLENTNATPVQRTTTVPQDEVNKDELLKQQPIVVLRPNTVNKAVRTGTQPNSAPKPSTLLPNIHKPKRKSSALKLQYISFVNPCTLHERPQPHKGRF